MKIVADRNTLLPAVTKIGGVVEKRQTLPILSNMLVRVVDGKMNLTATDLEVEINTIISVDSESEGEFTLPAKKFADICKALPDGAVVHIEIQGDKALIRSGRSRFSVGTLVATDYPSIEITNPSYSFSIKQKELKDMIEKTAFSMAHQDVRYYLNGMLVELGGDKIKTISTDGHRLALCEKGLSNAKLDNQSFLLPRKAVVEIGRLLGNEESEIDVDVSTNLARFTIEDTIFTTKLIDGKFPDYERVIPKNCNKTATIASDPFKSALVRASILSSEKYKGIRISVEGNILKLLAHNPEQEEAEEELEIDYKEDPITIGFNVGYLLDILNSINSDRISIDFSDTNSSSLIRDPEKSNLLYVVMPMRL